MRNRVSMLNKARKIDISGSSITVNQTVDASKQSRLDRFLDEAAPNAILNAGGRADEVRCFPGTREEVIGKVEKWMDGEGEPSRRMMWLCGPAGAGKSAIVQTVTERCQKRGIHAANFFFFRGDGTRDHAQPLVATLVYQLLRFYPALNDLLEDRLKKMPLAYKASTEEQFVQLISAPIRMVQQSAAIHGPIIIIVDGLDECTDERKQEQILKALYALVEENNCPFRVLVASRAEPHLVMTFNKIGTSVESIFLDDEYRPQDDIHRFVVAKFDEIKKVHSLARTLDEQWPQNTDIDAIVDKSSGQFIYAATVMRFIEYSPESPAFSLNRVRGMQPATDHSPLAQVDALYSYIFSKIRDTQTVKSILGAHFIALKVEEIYRFNSNKLFVDLMRRGQYEAIDIESFFADFAPIVRFASDPPMKLIFYHASLSDYVRDEGRSGIYYVDVAAIAAEWTLLYLDKFVYLDSLEIGIRILRLVERATPALSKSLLNASERKLVLYDLNLGNDAGPGWWVDLMLKIYQLYFESDSALYHQMLRGWIFFHHNNFNELPTFADAFRDDSVGHRIYMYYNWYLLTETIRSAVRGHT